MKIYLNKAFLKTVNLKKWYSITYPGDDIVNQFSPATTFKDLLQSLVSGDIYELIAGDSIARERIFWQLVAYSGGLNRYEDFYSLLK